MPATRAPRLTAVSATTRPSAPSAPVMAMTFPFMQMVSRAGTLRPDEIDLQWPWTSRRNAPATSDGGARKRQMSEIQPRLYPDLVGFRHQLPHLTEALRLQRRIKIVAI